MDAAVVRPRTDSPSLKMTPAPRKPMPVMIPCAMRVDRCRTVSTDAREPLRLVHGEEHEQARREAHERVGAEPGRPAVEAALHTDGAAPPTSATRRWTINWP